MGRDKSVEYGDTPLVDTLCNGDNPLRKYGRFITVGDMCQWAGQPYPEGARANVQNVQVQ